MVIDHEDNMSDKETFSKGIPAIGKKIDKFRLVNQEYYLNDIETFTKEIYI